MAAAGAAGTDKAIAVAFLAPGDDVHICDISRAGLDAAANWRAEDKRYQRSQPVHNDVISTYKSRAQLDLGFDHPRRI